MWSWAVPKGPTLDAGARRLAVQVEEHELDEHLVLEDARKVVWDTGFYQPAADPRTALDDGHLRFVLAGHKLRGAFALSQTRMGGDDRNWILVKVDDKTDDAAAKAEAETLAARIAGGADFAKLAIESSDDAATKRRGGDLGWFGADTYGSAFGMQVAALSDGQTSAPFKTDAGWVIVQRTASRQVAAGNDNLRAQVRETIGRRKLEDEWNRWLREMRGEAYVDVGTLNGYHEALNLLRGQRASREAQALTS